MSADNVGPTLNQYVETRLNLLTEAIRQNRLGATTEIAALAEAFKLAALAVKAASDAADIARDLRYQQRFEAQTDALAAAFASQQQAMQVAFVVAEKAVAAALAAADRMVSKAEMASDKRFEALNELRGMMNDMLTTLITRVEADQMFKSMNEKISANSVRVTVLEGRVNTSGGEDLGNRQSRMDAKAQWGMVITVVVAIIAAATFVVSFRTPPPQVLLEQSVPQGSRAPAK